MKERIIFHVDVNNAFLSWTAVQLLKDGYSVDIRTIPAVIGGDESKRHGIVLAKSPIAKKMGIVTAETLYSARKKCPGVKVYPPNFECYKENSDNMYKYLCKYTPDIERFSIDECFMDMSNSSYIYKDVLSLAYKIKDDIKKIYGFTVNVGVGNNKLCAKMASDFEKPDKVHTLFLNEIKDKMWPLDVNELFMVGKSSTSKLKELGINTIGELANADKKFLNKYFKSNGELMWQHANGIDNSDFEYKEPKNKGISVTETLEKDTTDQRKLKKILLAQTDKVCYQARKYKLYTTNVTLIIRTSTFINFTKQEILNGQTNDTEVVYTTILKILNSVFLDNPDLKVRNIGIRISNLKTKQNKQINIFDVDKKESNNNDIQGTIDQINEKYGTNSVIKAILIDK